MAIQAQTGSAVITLFMIDLDARNGRQVSAELCYWERAPLKLCGHQAQSRRLQRRDLVIPPGMKLETFQLVARCYAKTRSLILKKHRSIYILFSGLGCIALRFPDHAHTRTHRQESSQRAIAPSHNTVYQKQQRRKQNSMTIPAIKLLQRYARTQGSVNKYTAVLIFQKLSRNSSLYFDWTYFSWSQQFYLHQYCALPHLLSVTQTQTFAESIMG